MLPDLTRYLLLYKRLCIPHVGSFEIEQHEPEYSVVDKLIHPPQYSVRYLANEQLSDHQLDYIAASGNINKETARQQLIQLGSSIRKLAEKNTFNWNGVGGLKINRGSVSFQNHLPLPEGWQEVDAHKVLRENVEHSRLIGDRQTTAAISVKPFSGSRWALPMKWGWIILALAVLAIVFILFKNHFSPLGTGLKLKFF